MDRDAAKAALHTVAGRHLPTNARRYTMRIVDAIPPTSAMLGVRVDHKPVEGSVVERLDAVTVVKTGRTEFTLVDEGILPVLPEVGSKVRITPYARRMFDGKRVDEPKVEHRVSEEGVAITSTIFRIGDYRTPLPIDEPRCELLRDLVGQIEERKAPDGFRTVAQMLVDARAADFATIDPPDDADLMDTKPTLSFTVRTGKFLGRVSIIYWVVPDYYQIRFEPAGGPAEDVDDVDFTSVGAVLHERIDDDVWRKANVEVLRAPPRARRAA